MVADKAQITEIFSSIQGEGTHLGERHIFVRFQDCNMSCQYCDEMSKPGIEMTLDQVLAEIKALDRSDGPHPFVSLTGGEPLLYTPFLKFLLPKLRTVPFKIYLETNGVLWKQLEKVIEFCDVIAMDMKTPSVTKDRNYDADHRCFLERAKAREVLIKIVASREIDFAEFDREIAMVAAVAPETTVVLQPVSSVWGEDEPCHETMRVLQSRALRMIPDVRIVGRLHKMLNIR